MVNIKLVGSLQIGDKLFSMNDSEGTVYARQLGLPDNFYGGYVTEFRKTKYGILMCVNPNGAVCNLAYTDESLTKAGKHLLDIKTLEREVEPITTDTLITGGTVTTEEAHVIGQPDKVVKEVIKQESVTYAKNNKPKGKFH